MKKLIMLLVAIITTFSLFAGNVITYEASQKLNHTTGTTPGIFLGAFDVPITSHTFSNGTGTITFSGDVVSIGEYAFYSCYGLTSITIPNSVTSISNNAFSQCHALTAIMIPSSVTSIGDGAFRSCLGLTSIIVDSNNTIYDSRENCNAIIVTAANKLILGCQNTIIPNTVTSIGENAFRYCSLDSIVIPSSVNLIETGAFFGCWERKSIIVDSNNETYDSRESCNALIKTATNELIFGCQNTIIPNSVTSIGDYAFFNLHGLDSITIPNGVISIGADAFGDCIGLSSIEIPNSVISIGTNAFYNCNNLTSVTINSPTLMEGDYTSSFNIKNIFGEQVAYYVLGDSVTFIADYAFYNSYGLDSITIGNGVTSLGQYAFYYCPNLVSVSIGNSLKTIGDYAFWHCDTLSSINFPESLTSIGKYAFDYCRGLVNITIPSNVISIGESAFDCSSVTIKSPYIAGQTYTPSSNLKNIFGERVKSYVIDGSVISIGEHAFEFCYNLTSVTIGNSITSIGNSAFSSCMGLTSISIPNSVTSIGDFAFSGCSGVTSITIPSSVTSIGNNAFRDCANQGVYVESEAPALLGEEAFSYGITIYVPCGAGDAYRSAWGNWEWYYYFQEPETPFHLTILDSEYGSVNSQYTCASDTAFIEAIPDEGYYFEKWSDGDTNAFRTIIITEDLTLTANFSAIKYTITAEPNDPSMGTVIGGGEYGYNANVQLMAVANAGYEFVKWSNGETNNPYSFVANADLSIVAEFKESSSALEDITADNNATKVIVDGHVYIIRGNSIYNLTGSKVR